MCFIIIVLVVLQVIISFIVEAFVFKIQARERSRECSKHHKLRSLCGCKQGKLKNLYFANCYISFGENDVYFCVKYKCTYIVQCVMATVVLN